MHILCRTHHNEVYQLRSASSLPPQTCHLLRAWLAFWSWEHTFITIVARQHLAWIKHAWVWTDTSHFAISRRSMHIIPLRRVRLFHIHCIKEDREKMRYEDDEQRDNNSLQDDGVRAATPASHLSPEHQVLPESHSRQRPGPPHSLAPPQPKRKSFGLWQQGP